MWRGLTNTSAAINLARRSEWKETALLEQKVGEGPINRSSSLARQKSVAILFLTLIIERDRFLEPAFQIGRAVFVAGVCRAELGSVPASSLFVHSFPEFDSLARIIASAGHEQQADVVGFRFVLSTKREQ